MRVVGRCHDDRVNTPFLIQHLPEIFVLLRTRILLERVRGVVPIHIAQRHDILAFHLIEVPSALPPDADPGDVEFVIRGLLPCPSEYSRRDDQEGR